MGTFECTLCACNYNLRSGLEGHILNYHKRHEKKNRRKAAEKKTTVDLGKSYTKSSCLSSKNDQPTNQPKTLSSTNTSYMETREELILELLGILENNTTYSFDALEKQIADECNTIMSTEQNDQLDTTTATSPSLSDQHQNTSQSDHKFKRPEIPSLRRYRHPTIGLNRNHSNASTTGTYVSGSGVDGTGAAADADGVVVRDIDLRGDYVWADEAIWKSCDYGW